MAEKLAYYHLLPYEREWLMREEAGQRYYVVRLKDIPAIAGDGVTRDEAVADLREAFDEFVTAWLRAHKSVPTPNRAFTVPGAERDLAKVEPPRLSCVIDADATGDNDALCKDELRIGDSGEASFELLSKAMEPARVA